MGAAENIHSEFIYQHQLMELTKCKQVSRLRDYLDSRNIEYGIDANGGIYSTVTWFNASKQASNDIEFKL